MEVLRDRNFQKALSALPPAVWQAFEKQEKIFRENWTDPRLHTKKLKEPKGIYSLRITRRYRALFYFKNGDAIFFVIGHRKDIYR